MPSKKQRVLIVDGYNVLNAQYPGLTGRVIEDARDSLVEKLHDYAAYSDQTVIVVFDAWQSDRKKRTYDEKDARFSVVFTQNGETADQYIERICGEYAQRAFLGKIELRVATSDFVEQMVVLGRGASRVSAREILAEIEYMKSSALRHTGRAKSRAKSTVLENLPDDVREKLERMRRGEK
ncbi:MAG: NYN domain-containing protein [Christensenellales bacterium]|jgi:predicted RNA-binding protein with PIN domain